MVVPHLQVATTVRAAVCLTHFFLYHQFLLLLEYFLPLLIPPPPYVPCSPAGNTVNACCLGPVLYSHSSKSLETKLEQTWPSPCLFYATVFPNLHKYVCPTSDLSKDRYTTSLTTLLPVWLEPSFLKRSTASSHGIPAVTMPHTCDPWLGIAQEKEDEYVTYLALQNFYLDKEERFKS